VKFYDYRVWALGVAFDVRALSESDALWVATHPCKRNGGRVFCTAEQVDSVVMRTAETEDERRRRLPMTEPLPRGEGRRLT